MRSISTKLIVAFMSIGFVSVAIIVLTALWNTRVEFIRFLSDETQAQIVGELADYHQQNGSWNGLDAVLLQRMERDANRGPDQRARRIPPFILVDESGMVIASNDRFRRGEVIDPSNFPKGTAISESGEVIGIYIPIRANFVGLPRDLEFIQRINRMLLYGALIAAGLALFLGIFLSRTLTRPIRELTRATHAVSEGDLSQQVPVRSEDELGELAQAFNRMSAELSRSVSARKQMTADIAHELRTPLSLILGHAEAVHDGVLPPSRENFEIIREEAARLEHLVNDLRTLSLADAGELSMEFQTVEPQRLIQDVAAVYLYQAQKRNITIEQQIAPDLPAIEVDPVRMTQVLTNILDNALRHTPEQGRIRLGAKRSEDGVELSVQDSGPGLGPDDLERMFERFYRADPSRQRGDGGSGLGLAIAKSIVQAHGGQILAESGPGSGLKIRIRLPKKV